MLDNPNHLSTLLEVSDRLEPVGDTAIQDALEFANSKLGTSMAIISRVEGQMYRVEHFHAPGSPLQLGQCFPLGQTYCVLTLKADDVVSISEMSSSPYSGHPCYTKFGLETYIAVPLKVNGNVYGTLNFSAPQKRTEPWSQDDRSLVRILGLLVGRILERRQTQNQVSALNSSLQETSRRLLDAKERLNLFASALSHDLKEPLRTIEGFTKLLSRSAGERLQEEEREFLQYIGQGAERLKHLTSGLLSYIRLEGRLESAEAVDLNEVLDSVRRDLAQLIQEEEAQVITEKLPTLRGSHWQLQTVLQNLLSNAIKFRQSDKAPVVSVTCEEESGSVFLRVQDNGIGFQESSTSRMFELFGRLHSQESYPGTGIGLAIVERIVSNHGGTISASSTENQGSCFTLCFPIEAKARPKSKG